MLGTSKTDWGKVGVWVAVGTFAFGALVAVIWNYADTVNSVKNISNDVIDLKRKTDELLRSSLDAAARLSSLERRQAETSRTLPPPSPSASSAASGKQ
jgi:hypothetical protein